MKHKEFIIVLLITILMVPAAATVEAAQQNSFRDLTNHWSREFVLKLTEKGIFEGYADGTFKPNNNITVAEFITIVTQVMELEMVPDDGPWYQMYINAALNASLVVPGEFSSTDFNRPITRGEMARMIARGLELAPIEGNTHYSDSIQTPVKYRGYINAITELNIVNGYADGSFGYDRNMTRGEAATIISRMLQVQAGEVLPVAGAIEGFVEPELSVEPNVMFRGGGDVFSIQIANIDEYTDEYLFKAECISFPELNYWEAFDGKGVYKQDMTVWRDRTFIKGWSNKIIHVPMAGFNFKNGQEITYRITIQKRGQEKHYYITGVIEDYGFGYFN
ncbi:S-layer homology domain-containing protein [Alkaliphilus crotonatoxidans]